MKYIVNSKAKVTLIFSLLATAFIFLASPAHATVSEDGVNLSILSAIILGLVEGFTEYLPISSTGHLLVTNKILGLGGTETADNALETYAIAIQIGAIAAVLILYKKRIMQMFDGLLGKSDEGKTVLFAVMAAFIPTAIIGLIFKDIVRENLFGALPIAAAWIIGGIAILALTFSGTMDKAGTELNKISIKQAVIIGCAQSLALWPGTSRSLITIIAALLIGLSLSAAVEFSFLLGLITLSAATFLAIFEDGSELINEFGPLSPAIGMVVAFVAALVSIKWMVGWLQSRSLAVFGYYRIVIGVATLALLATTELFA